MHETHEPSGVRPNAVFQIRLSNRTAVSWPVVLGDDRPTFDPPDREYSSDAESGENG